MKNKRWVLDVINDEATGDQILQLPDDVLAETGWREGDTLEWIDNKDGTWTLRKKDA